MPKMPPIKVEAHAVTATESNSDGFSDWAEVTLSVQYGSHAHVIELTRGAGEEILRQLHKVLHPWAGQSIKENIQAELDSVVNRLLSDGTPEPVEDQEDLQAAQEEWLEYGEDRGRAQGLATAIANINNPYKPNVDAVRKDTVNRLRAAG